MLIRQWLDLHKVVLFWAKSAWLSCLGFVGYGQVSVLEELILGHS